MGRVIATMATYCLPCLISITRLPRTEVVGASRPLVMEIGDAVVGRLMERIRFGRRFGRSW